MSGARRAFSSPPVPVSLARTRRDAQKKKGLQCCCIYPIQENRHRVYPNRVCPSPLWADSLPWSSPLTDPSGDESDASRLDGGGTKGAGLTGRTVRRAESWKQMTAVPWPYKLHSFLVGNFFFSCFQSRGEIAVYHLLRYLPVELNSARSWVVEAALRDKINMTNATFSQTFFFFNHLTVDSWTVVCRSTYCRYMWISAVGSFAKRIIQPLWLWAINQIELNVFHILRGELV